MRTIWTILTYNANTIYTLISYRFIISIFTDPIEKYTCKLEDIKTYLQKSLKSRIYLVCRSFVLIGGKVFFFFNSIASSLKLNSHYKMHICGY